VQEVVEQAVRRVCRERVILTGASRTDAGVHAAGQVSAFTSTPDEARGVGWPADRGTDRLVRAVNGSLPPDVLVTAARVVEDAFDPIAGALEKEYTYTIAAGEPRPVFDRAFCYWTWHALDAARMNEAAAHLVGEHDFAAFAQINHGRRTTVRTVFRCSVEEVMHEPMPGVGPSPRVIVRVSGSGFLYNMVRIIAGTLLEVGRGKIEPNMVPAILESKDRPRAGPTLPPEGLRLEWVRYSSEE
jgi:tRNA pseudouridine38-40 synthase